jgi:hypothetical protein
MSTGKADRVWTGWEGLRVWRELVPLLQEESAEVADVARIFGGYVLARRYLTRGGRRIPLPLRPSAA